MPNHTEIYKNGALQYDLMISKQQSLADIIAHIRPYAGLDIVDLGAGTGRLTSILAPAARSILALDASAAMLDITSRKLEGAGLANWKCAVCDLRQLPLSTSSADLVVAGWSMCYLTHSGVQDWQDNLRRIIGEIIRVLRPGGTAIVFETMGTGARTPDPPESLKPYYAMLSEEFGLCHDTFRLDYHFDSLEQAEELTSFFFGDELAARVRREGLSQLPECAGVWWLHVPLA
ncbi:class I SAM-dependent methyltransferase [Paenibacillus lutrae]|uniref:Methyltransferase domain-containing protein n=1 Tax=Paenibacillus lutrae TaxID=2078573 RepID=A0A7X3FL75_9BACL|nr:class I SAM-dependent methyltransferase [Paenibacillus lutrae]MVP01668.1 methyltransferase domain-containing protein [Paenibacillus lutrae]